MNNMEIMTFGDKDYYILKEKESNGINYIYLSNVDDPKDIMIRKSSNKDKDLYVPLDGENEFNKACLLLFKN